MYKTLLVLYSLLATCLLTHAQKAITNDVLDKVVIRFEDANGYTLQQKTASVNNSANGLPNDNIISCMAGKQVLVVAVFNRKPANLFGRMLVTKRFNKKIAYDEHKFQAPALENSLNIYYSLLAVAFPQEVNSLNCNANLQIFDKANPKDKVWLLVFAK